jgi:holo-[acyl-carrier protein] synthase
MIVGIGIDTTLLSRFLPLSSNEKFIKRILTLTEEEDFKLLPLEQKANFLAKRFAGKEAFAKALGTGIGKEFNFKSIAILKNLQNAPFIKILDETLLTKISTAFISFADENINTEKLISAFVVLQKTLTNIN